MNFTDSRELSVVGALLWLAFSPTRAPNWGSKDRIPVDQTGFWRPRRAYPGRPGGVTLTPMRSPSLRLWLGTRRAKTMRPNLGS
jgi:hypothetical protein